MARAGLDKESEMCGSEWEGWRMGGGGDSAICGLGILLTWYFTGFTCIHPNTICMGEALLPLASGVCTAGHQHTSVFGHLTQTFGRKLMNLAHFFGQK